MNPMTLVELAATVAGEARGANVAFSSVAIDSRTLPSGSLFVALKGPQFDGHEYCEQARQRGARAAMVSREIAIAMPHVLVADTRVGLTRLAAAWRRHHPIPLIAITGSNGKTTIKEMIAAVLGTAGATLATQGNLNNEIGVPLTLLRLTAEHAYAVVEMGANHAGEIAALTKIARPDVTVISNAAPAHLAGFGTVEGVARAKGEIIQGLSADGAAVLNADDRFLGLWRALATGRRCITFGLAADADVRASAQSIRSTLGADGFVTRFELRYGGSTVPIALSLAGRHSVINALTAAAAALALGIEPTDLRRGLESVRPVPGRLQLRRGIGGVYIIDDSYNANPGSFETAFEVLGNVATEAWLVLGDMGELGDDASSYHEQLGARAKSSGLCRLFAVGEHSRAAVRRFGSGGLHFSSHEALIEALLPEIHSDLTILVKGSRRQRMERVANALSRADNG